MSQRKIVGVLLLIVGVILIVASLHMKSLASMGEMRVSGGEERVSEENRPYVRPLARERSREFSEQAEERIGEGEEMVNYYQQMGTWLQVGGIAFLIVGVGALFFKKRK